MKLLISILLFANLTLAQNIIIPTYCYVYAVMPTVVGGLDSLQMRIVLPDSTSHYCIEGNIYILTYIDSLGNLDSAKVIKGLSYGYDEAALNAVSQSKFTPAYTYQLIHNNFDGSRKYRLRPIPGILVVPVKIEPK